MLQSLYRKVIWMSAECSPNVRLARAEMAAGKPLSGEVLVPGVMTFEVLQDARRNWDEMEQCIGLDGRFYAGKDARLYPMEWLRRAWDNWRGPKKLRVETVRIAKGIGVDPAEGGDSTAFAAVDEWGLLEVVSRKTPNTSVIQGELVAFMRRWGCEQDGARVCIDAGGGGKQLADNMRAGGRMVRTVRFGETITPEPKRAKRLFPERLETKEDRYVYANRRAEMYHELSLMLEPDGIGISGKKGGTFALPPSECGKVEAELNRQLSLIPKVITKAGVTWTMWDPEGRIRMLPKNKKSAESDEPCLTEILRCSPDEADAVVLAVWAMNHRGYQTHAGVPR